MTPAVCLPLTGVPPTGLSAFPQVYVLKRPYVDEFLRRMGELFECVLFTASLAKVPEGGPGVRKQERPRRCVGGPAEAAGGARTASGQKHPLCS